MSVKLISKNSSNGGGWTIFSEENVGNVSYVLNGKKKLCSCMYLAVLTYDKK
jgi:hypothetical protein